MDPLNNFKAYSYFRKQDDSVETLQARDTEGRMILLMSVLKELGVKVKFEVEETPIQQAMDVEVAGQKQTIPTGIRRTIKAKY